MQTHNECKHIMYRQLLHVHISHEEPGHMAVCSYAYNVMHKNIIRTFDQVTIILCGY